MKMVACIRNSILEAYIGIRLITGIPTPKELHSGAGQLLFGTVVRVTKQLCSCLQDVRKVESIEITIF